MKKRLGDSCKSILYGVEGYNPNQKKLVSEGVRVFDLDIERDKLPIDDATIDIVIANQVLEHCKDVFWVISEASRVLRHGGALLVGVPNLASLHNRIRLMVGKQPTCIYTLGPHVRGYTFSDFKSFIETDGYFSVEDVKGANYYPFPPAVARGLAKVFSLSSVSIILKIRRTDRKGTFIEILNTRFFETNYYIGDGKTLFDR